MIDRNQLAEELKLRKQIRKAIKIVKERRKKVEKATIQEEQQLRDVIRKLIKEAEVSTAVPQRSTGINVLEDLLKKIVPILEDDYKQMTTSEEQRRSYRGHIVNGIQSLLAPEKVFDDTEGLAEQEIDVEIGDDEEDPFIDIRSDQEIAQDEEDAEETEVEKFGIKGQDETGRNLAYETFKKIENNLLRSYELLSDKKDQDEFYDYLITNVKLYFDKFEEELQPSLEPEITTPEYEEEKEEESTLDTAGTEEVADEEEEDLGLPDLENL